MSAAGQELRFEVWVAHDGALHIAHVEDLPDIP